jgi:hypothetical protein
MKESCRYWPALPFFSNWVISNGFVLLCVSGRQFRTADQRRKSATLPSAFWRNIAADPILHEFGATQKFFIKALF